jgi:isopenicillin N synthase-like dioxygenase
MWSNPTLTCTDTSRGRAGEPGALDRAAAELRHALTEIGFYTIFNHGVPAALVHEVYRQVARSMLGRSTRSNVTALQPR